MLWLHFDSSLICVLILDNTILYILKHLPDYVHSTSQASLFIRYIHVYVLFCDILQRIVLYFS